ncbi:AMP-binding protein [Lichenibacterium ramalinae]|uniref:3-methylmercaptopropionyl-CoA ligase n=1 Tax=Lichenibacterium ramalinae TaxID=2316527 RepID=A0A4V1RIB9_9HYPH|nr:AMP-binding protein [Lichenibacterium ramalinae]RYB03207.1 AMP-binding protein [Lichenibacterium ramalinae]
MEPSFVTGARDVPLLDVTIGRALGDAARRWPDRDALVAPWGCDEAPVRWSWAELDRRAETVAAGLLALGLAPGDRIGMWSLNTAEWALVQFAAAKAGLILVTVNPAYRVVELDYALNKVGCAALVLGPPFKGSDYLGMLRELAPELDGAAPGALAAPRLPALRLVVAFGTAAPGTVPFDAVAGFATPETAAAVAALAGTIRPEDDANIQFTSGTTGTPKGVTLTHRNILNNGYFVGRAMRLAPEDRICIPVPLYHCFGMVMGNLASVTHGAAMVYPGRGFDPLATLRTAAEERCTALYGVPTMFIAALDHPDFAAFDLSRLRTGIMAGSPCPIAVMRKVVERMHLSGLTICYGMTETSPVSFQSAIDDPLERRVSTIGRVHPHLDVKIVDPEGRVLPRGEAGELCTRGYAVMRGYWGEPERTAAVLDAEGWMHTGDLATVDAEGFGNVVGRIKDLIIRGGENVSPREVEDYLYRHPDVQDVAVFGVADPRYGEEVCAWIRPRPGSGLTPEAVRAFCTGRIAHQKVPRYVELVDSFPMTVTGKMQKFLMRDTMERRLGLAAAATA